MPQRVCVYEAKDAVDAVLARDRLEAAGVPVEARGLARGGLAGAIPIGDALPSLWVLPHNAARAAAVLAAPVGPAAEAWACGCGERVEGQFGACWRCGREAPGAG